MDRRGETTWRLAAAEADERRLMSAMVVRGASRCAASGLNDPSRAISGLMSAGVRDSTPRNTRSISELGLAIFGDRVASGPVMTTPV